MGVWLLAVESLVLALLWAATGMAWRARRPSLKRNIALAIMLLVPLGIFGIWLLIHLKFSWRVELNPAFPYVLALQLGGYVLGVVVLWILGRRRLPEELESPEGSPGVIGRRASRWPLGKLAVAMSLVIGVCVATCWGLDRAAHQRLALLRAEASKQGVAAAPDKPADGENAAFIYEQAFALLPESGTAWDWPKKPDGEWADDEYEARHPEVLRDPALLEFLESQQPLFKLLHQAAAKPECVFERDYTGPRLDWLLPEVTNMREAMRLLLLQARVYAAEGNLTAAVKEIQSVHRMAEHLSTDAIVVSVLVSFAIDDAASATLQDLLSGQRPTTEVMEPLGFVLREASFKRLHQAFLMEEAIGLAAFTQMANSPEGFLSAGNPLDENSQAKLKFGAAIYRVLLLDVDVQAYRAELERYQRLAQSSPKEVRDERAKVKSLPGTRPRGLMTSMLTPALEACLDAAARHAAHQVTAQSGVAVHRYRAENGKLPQTLADLVPKFLPEVPLDPYDDQPLRWKVTGDAWVVYSIGEDLKDDGGVPMNYTHPNRTGDIGFYAVKPPEPEEEAEAEEEAEMETEHAEEPTIEPMPENSP